MLNKILSKIKSDTDVPLWTRDYSILTIGSIVSYMGTSTMYFIIGLWVLDYSKSILYYSLYLFLHNLTKIIVPIVAGPYLDRFSRRKAIYTLDYISAGVFLSLFFLFGTNFFGYATIAVFTVIISAIDSVYHVAFSSFFPMLVHEKNLTKAYSVFSVIETVSYFMIPLATFLYHLVGIRPVFLGGAVVYCIAATTEVFIRAKEEYTSKEKSLGLKKYAADLKEGIKLFKTEKALLYIVLTYLFIYAVFGMQNTVLLPYFRDTFKNGDYWYMFAMSATLSGRFSSGFMLYFMRVAKKHRYAITLIGFIIFAICSMFTISTKIIFIIVCLQYYAGVCDAVCYNFQSSATMFMLDDDKKGRYNGVFSTVANAGLLCGDLLGGLLSGVMLLTTINFTVSAVALVAVIILFFVLGRNSIKKLFIGESDKNG